MEARGRGHGPTTSLSLEGRLPWRQQRRSLVGPLRRPPGDASSPPMSLGASNRLVPMGISSAPTQRLHSPASRWRMISKSPWRRGDGCEKESRAIKEKDQRHQSSRIDNTGFWWSRNSLVHIQSCVLIGCKLALNLGPPQSCCCCFLMLWRSIGGGGGGGGALVITVKRRTGWSCGLLDISEA